jgi:hypothetical protein
MNPDILWAINALKANINDSGKCCAYYDGKQPLAFATEDFQNAFGSLLKAFSLNMMPAVVDCVRDRLKLSGFTTQDKKSSVGFTEGAENDSTLPAGQQTDPIDSKILDIWRANRMDQRAGRVHLNALKAGNAYVIVWGDQGEVPTIYPEKADKVAVKYDEERPGHISRAVKAWIDDDDGKAYLTLYYDDRIEKYITRNKVEGGLPEKAESFIPRETENEAWPLPNLYNRVPVFHFANNADIGNRGYVNTKTPCPCRMV